MENSSVRKCHVDTATKWIFTGHKSPEYFDFNKQSGIFSVVASPDPEGGVPHGWFCPLCQDILHVWTNGNVSSYSYNKHGC